MTYQQYLEKARKEEEKAKRLAFEARVASLMAEVKPLSEGFDEAGSKLYVAYKQNENDLEQRLAFMGLNKTGYKELNKNNLVKSFDDNLSKNKLSKTNALNDLNRKIAEAKAKGEGEVSAVNAKYINKLADYSKKQSAKNKKDTETSPTENRVLFSGITPEAFVLGQRVKAQIENNALKSESEKEQKKQDLKQMFDALYKTVTDKESFLTLVNMYIDNSELTREDFEEWKKANGMK